MKRFIYTSESNNELFKHENMMRDVYLQIVDSYRIRFETYGFSIQAEIYWYNSDNDEVSTQRLPFIKGYMSVISFEIQRDGKLVCIDEQEGSYLTSCWTIASIAKKTKGVCFHRNSYLEVTLCTDTIDVKEDLDEYLEIVKEMFVESN